MLTLIISKLAGQSSTSTYEQVDLRLAGLFRALAHNGMLYPELLLLLHVLHKSQNIHQGEG